MYSYTRTHPGTIQPQERRRHPGHGYAQHVTAAEAAEAAILRNPPDVVVATDAHIGMSEIAARAGVTLHVAIRAVKALAWKESELIVPLRPRPGLRPRDYLPRARGEALAEQIKPQKLTPDKITLAMLAQYFGCNRSYPWAALELLEDSGLVLLRRAGVHEDEIRQGVGGKVYLADGAALRVESCRIGPPRRGFSSLRTITRMGRADDTGAALRVIREVEAAAG